MFDNESLIFLYRSFLEHGKQGYQVLDFFTYDEQFTLKDHWHFYEKKYLLSGKSRQVLFFETYEELESYALFVANELHKRSLYILDNVTFNEALFHSAAIDNAFEQILKYSKKIDLELDDDPKSGIFGRIFRA